MKQNHEFTTAQRIFKIRYTVSVPRNVIDDPTMERHRGSIATGNADLDAFSINRPRIVDLPIARLAEIYALGVKPQFKCAREQSPEIYKALVDHLEQGKTYYETSFLRNEESEELLADLMVLDEFAAWMWKVAHKYMPKDDRLHDGGMSQRAKERYTPMGRPGQPVQAEAVEVFEEHKSIMAPVAEKMFIQRRGGWVG